MMEKYDGHERRKMREEDHDLLTRVDTNLINYHALIQAHMLADEKSFKQIRSDVGWLQKITFMGLGALALLKIFLK